MTRITNFRYKRQYVSSTEAPIATVELEAQPNPVHDDPPEALASSSEPQPPKKKRKRSRSKKSGDVKIADDAAASDEATGAANLEKDLTAPTERTPRQKRRDREKWEKERRKKENLDQTAVIGIGEAGADEDDFHTFKRRKVEVDREEAGVVQKKKSSDEPSKQLEGTTPRPNAPKPRKVVNF
ncbi:hypothetical protein ONZ45_g4364 [Pleurotus djamor]|nr:hypothetical protein ONZ45_g4364 [Pleurotus djamor]